MLIRSTPHPGFHRRAMLAGAGVSVVGGSVACKPAPGDGEAARSGIHVPAQMKQTVELGPGLVTTVQVSDTVIGSGFTVIETFVAPGAATPFHVNARADETLVVLNGRLEIRCDGAWIGADLGATVFLPRGVRHGFINRTDRAALCLSVFRPGGIEALLSEIAGGVSADRAALALSHGITLLGPLPQI